MSWITDWTSSLWNDLFTALRTPLDTWMNQRRTASGIPDEPPDVSGSPSWEHKTTGFPAPVEALFKLVGALTTALQMTGVKWFAAMELERYNAVKGQAVFPPNTETLAPFAASREDLQMYFEQIRWLTGKHDDIMQAYHELAKKTPDAGELRSLWNRGLVTADYMIDTLKELGYQDFKYEFQWTAEGDVVGFEQLPKEDRANVRKLFERLPDIGSVIQMEMRDAFPMSLDNYPPEEQTEAWQRWKAETGAHTPAVYDWEPGQGKSLTDTLKEGSDYGPQSFESWWLKARSRYSKTFEKAAQAQGINKYWAMKLWESHWQLPGYAMLQQLLYRSPEVDERRMADILRWQDYPPGMVDEMVRVAFRPLTRVDVRRMHLRGVIGVPRVFQSYLAFGYNIQNAVRMTAFTVVWNVDRTYGDLINEVLKSFGQGALTIEDAAAQIWGLVGFVTPDVMPDWVAEELTAEQIEAVKATYDEIRGQLETRIQQQLSIAFSKAELARHRSRLDTAKKQFVSWEWTPGQAREYLVRYGYSAARVEGLFAEWTPLREREERLPSLGMLEDFLVEQGMSVDAWKGHMSRLGYSDVVILQILEGVGKLPTRQMLESFLRAEGINVDTFRSYMRRLGYSNFVVDQTLAIIEAES